MLVHVMGSKLHSDQDRPRGPVLCGVGQVQGFVISDATVTGPLWLKGVLFEVNITYEKREREREKGTVLQEKAQ